MRQVRMDRDWFAGQWEGAEKRQDVRRQWERLLNLAEFLDEQEKIFLETAVEQGGRVSRLSRLTRRSPTSLTRQIRDITRRLLRWELRAMVARPEAFSSFEKACLREHLVRRRPLTRVAEGLGVSVYEVRKTIASGRCKAERLISVNSEQLSIEEGGDNVCL